MKARLTGISLVLLLISGCDRNSQIKVYRVVKAPLEESAAGQQNTMPTNLPSPGFPGGAAMPQTSMMAVPAPPGWEPQPPSQMRQASFLVKGDKGAVVDISLVGLGGSAS